MLSKKVYEEMRCGLQTEFLNDFLIRRAHCQMLFAFAWRTVHVIKSNSALHEIVFSGHCHRQLLHTKQEREKQMPMNSWSDKMTQELKGYPIPNPPITRAGKYGHPVWSVNLGQGSGLAVRSTQERLNSRVTAVKIFPVCTHKPGKPGVTTAL